MARSRHRGLFRRVVSREYALICVIDGGDDASHVAKGMIQHISDRVIPRSPCRKARVSRARYRSLPRRNRRALTSFEEDADRRWWFCPRFLARSRPQIQRVQNFADPADSFLHEIDARHHDKEKCPADHRDRGRTAPKIHVADRTSFAIVMHHG